MDRNPVDSPPLDRARRLGLGPTLGNLIHLVRLAGPRSDRRVLAAIAVTALAALTDAASFGLLRNAAASITARSGDPAGLWAAFAFLLVALVGAALRFVAQRATVNTQYAIARTLAVRAFGTLQRQDYADFLRRGPSEGFAAFERLQLVVYFGLNSLIGGAVAALSAAVLLVAVAWLFPLAGAVLGLATILFVAEIVWRGGTEPAGEMSGLAQRRSLVLYEARSAFRHVFLANGQSRICEDFATVETAYRNEQSRATVAGQTSRHAVEIVGLLAALAVLAVYAAIPGDVPDLVPLFAVLGLAVLRLLPQLATIRAAVRVIAMHADVSDEVRALLARDPAPQDRRPAEPVRLTDRIVLDAVTLEFDDRTPTLRSLDLTIARGARIGIMGPSGIGKSTLLDLVCGALIPDSGSVRIDGHALDRDTGRAWRDNVGVVSQQPVMLGETLGDAIVYPERPDAIDRPRLAAAMAQSGVDRMLPAFARGLDTPIGEASALLSGGQRQRLALAHALYRARDLLVLDEATGQLDADSEAAIVAAIAALPRDLTILVASHRPGPFACCDVVYRLADGRLVRRD